MTTLLGSWVKAVFAASGMEAVTEQGLLIATPELEIMNQNLLAAFEIKTDM